MNATQELPRGQQLLLQRLVANHCMPHKEAIQIFESLVAHGKDYIDDDDDNNNEGEGTDPQEGDVVSSIMGPEINTLQDAFVSINRQLKPGFGLEIITMVDTTSGDGAKHYHAVVNTAADEIAKSENVFSKSWNPHERAFVRLVIGALVDQNGNGGDDDEDDEDDDDEDKSNNKNKKKSREAGIRRADLINLRSELEHGFKLTLDQAKKVVAMLLEEKWLRVSSSTEKNRRESVQVIIEIAPRSYMELYHYITGLGMEADKLPQFLYHRD